MYTCSICNRKFEHHYSLAAHVGHHKLHNKVKCDICGKNYHPCRISNHRKAHDKDRNCLACGHPIRGVERKKFCNHSCAASYLNKTRERSRQEYPCKVCGKPINGGSFCSYECSNEHRYQVYLKRWLNGDVNGNSGKQGISAYVRRWLFERAQHRCEKCGWCVVNPVTKRIPLSVHHKNGNSYDTRPENIELLCPNHHSLTPTYGILNRGKGRKKRYAGVAQW